MNTLEKRFEHRSLGIYLEGKQQGTGECLVCEWGVAGCVRACWKLHKPRKAGRPENMRYISNERENRGDAVVSWMCRLQKGVGG